MSEPFSDSEIRGIRGACADGPYPVSISGETWQAVEARWLATHDALVRERDALREACERARSYLEARGIRHHGTEGRTVVLPMLDAALECK